MSIEEEVLRIIATHDPKTAYAMLQEASRAIESARSELRPVIREAERQDRAAFELRVIEYFDSLPETKRTRPKTTPTRQELVAQHFDVSVATVQKILQPITSERRREHRDMVRRIEQDVIHEFESRNVDPYENWSDVMREVNRRVDTVSQ
jgi:hypothetical protein